MSVVTPTRNRLPLLQAAIESVLRQTTDDWEMIVVDDASDDGTWEWLQSLDDERIRAIRLSQHKEQSATRNTGFRAARGEFIVSLDDDDMLAEDALEIHSRALSNEPDAVASIAGFRAFDESGSEKIRHIVKRRLCRSIWRDILFGWTATVGQAAIRSKTLRSIGGWNESFVRATDHEMWARLTRLGPVVLSPEVVLIYRVHSGQWRPPADELMNIMTRAREVAVEQTEGAERSLGERILSARAHAIQAGRYYAKLEPVRALFSYFKAIRTYPGAIRSPLTRSTLLQPMTRCLLGSTGLRIARSLGVWVRTRRGKELDFSVRESRRLEADGTSNESDK